MTVACRIVIKAFRQLMHASGERDRRRIKTHVCVRASSPSVCLPAACARAQVRLANYASTHAHRLTTDESDFPAARSRHPLRTYACSAERRERAKEDAKVRADIPSPQMATAHPTRPAPCNVVHCNRALCSPALSCTTATRLHTCRLGEHCVLWSLFPQRRPQNFTAALPICFCLAPIQERKAIIDNKIAEQQGFTITVAGVLPVHVFCPDSIFLF